MTNIEKLEAIGILEEIRQRVSNDFSFNGKDTSNDHKINKMSNSELVSHYCGWYLGDESWWKNFKSIFDNLERFDEESK